MTVEEAVSRIIAWEPTLQRLHIETLREIIEECRTGRHLTDDDCRAACDAALLDLQYTP